MPIMSFSLIQRCYRPSALLKYYYILCMYISKQHSWSI